VLRLSTKGVLAWATAETAGLGEMPQPSKIIKTTRLLIGISYVAKIL
jgi:hypothetical protein